MNNRLWIVSYVTQTGRKGLAEYARNVTHGENLIYCAGIVWSVTVEQHFHITMHIQGLFSATFKFWYLKL